MTLTISDHQINFNLIADACKSSSVSKEQLVTQDALDCLNKADALRTGAMYNIVSAVTAAAWGLSLPAAIFAIYQAYLYESEHDILPSIPEYVTNYVYDTALGAVKKSSTAIYVASAWLVGRASKEIDPEAATKWIKTACLTAITGGTFYIARNRWNHYQGIGDKRNELAEQANTKAQSAVKKSFDDLAAWLKELPQAEKMAMVDNAKIINANFNAKIRPVLATLDKSGLNISDLEMADATYAFRGEIEKIAMSR
jgi:hypothetical protein